MSKTKVFELKQVKAGELVKLPCRCPWRGCTASYQGDLPQGWAFLMMFYSKKPLFNFRAIPQGDFYRDTALCPEHVRARGFWSEVQRVYENCIWTSLPSSLRIAWNGVLKPRHFLGVRLAVRMISWISSSDTLSMSI